MKQSTLARLKKLEDRYKSDDVGECICTMKDGTKRAMHWLSVLQHWGRNRIDDEDDDIVNIQTKDPHFYNFWGGLLPITYTGKSMGNH